MSDAYFPTVRPEDVLVFVPALNGGVTVLAIPKGTPITVPSEVNFRPAGAFSSMDEAARLFAGAFNRNRDPLKVVAPDGRLIVFDDVADLHVMRCDGTALLGMLKGPVEAAAGQGPQRLDLVGVDGKVLSISAAGASYSRWEQFVSDAVRALNARPHRFFGKVKP